MPVFSINVDIGYTEIENLEDRIRAAANDGFKFVELFLPEGRDMARLGAVAKECGVEFASVVAEPRFTFSFPGADFDEFFRTLAASLERAKLLGCPRLVITTGLGFPAKKRQVQMDEMAIVLAEAAEMGQKAGIEIVIEAVNTKVDHPGVLLDNTADAAYVVEKANHPNLWLQYDLYHSVASGEDPLEMLPKYKHLIRYVQIADAPGRGEPGSGEIDWEKVIPVIDAIGYTNPVGLEIYPTQQTSKALQYIKTFAR